MSSIGSKAQMSQVFIIFMAIAVIIATLFIGVKVLGSLGSSSCEAEISNFFTQWRHHEDTNLAYGSRTTFAFEHPCGAKEVCFVDARILDDPQGFTSDKGNIQALIRGGVKENIFLFFDGKQQSAYDERILLSDLGTPTPNGERCYTDTIPTQGRGRALLLT